MKLNVLIVDDEPIVCKGLRETVPWDELDVHIVGEAHDGEEALEVLDREDVDLVLSDIRMPGMDGLELARQVSERYPGKRVVMLSGYDEFEYAKQALRLGVKDYLLKPVDIGELMGVVRNIRDELAKERNREWQAAAYRLLSALVLGEQENVRHPALELAAGQRYRLLAGAIEDYASAVQLAGPEEQKALKQEWAGKVEETLSDAGSLGKSLLVGPNRLLVLCRLSGPDDDKSVFRRMIETIRQQPGLRMWCCLSRPFTELDGIHNRYREVMDGLSAFPVMNDRVYEAAEIPKPERAGIPEETVQSFRQLIERGSDGETLRWKVDQLFETFRSRRYGLNDVAAALRELENRLFAWLPARQAFRFRDGFDVSLYCSYDDLKELFIRDLEPFVVREGMTARAEQQMLVDKALRYMKEHYAKDLKAARVAEWINVSPNYFSQLIKQATGKHFNDLLHEIRIDKAKQLLAETDYRIFQVGRLVGYKEYKYFVHIFKKLTSVSPSQYRMMAYRAKRERDGDGIRSPAETREDAHETDA